MKGFTQRIRVGLRETDATGVLYFADQFKLVLQVFEEFLIASGFSLGHILDHQEFLLPIVHAEGDYLVPLVVGDELEISLTVFKIGTSSFTCHYQLFDLKKGSLAGRASLVHVVLSRMTQKSIPIPPRLKEILDAIHLQELPCGG